MIAQGRGTPQVATREAVPRPGHHRLPGYGRHRAGERAGLGLAAPLCAEGLGIGFALRETEAFKTGL